MRTGVEQANEQSSEIATFTTIIRYFLLSFAGIALFVGAFVIFNTLSITVAQRMREFATLRTLGASRRQVLRSVILEALVIGLGASIVGLFSGLALAVGLSELFKALNLELPQTETVFATRTIVVSLLVGTLVTLVAGLFPAIRATRVPPIAAVREGATMPRGRFARFTPYIASRDRHARGASLSATGRSPTTSPLGDRFGLLGLGVLALFVGVAMLSSRLVRPLARVVGIPARRIGGAAGKIAERNAQRNPGRTAATAAALMIGIALVTFISVLANGLRVSNSDAIERQIQSDLIVTSQDGYTEFPAAVGDAVEEVEGVETVSNVRQDIIGDRRRRREPDGSRRPGQRGVRLPLGGGLGRGAHAARHGRRGHSGQRRGGPGPRRRRLLHSAFDGQPDEGVRGPGHLRGQPLLSPARLRERLPGGVRRALRPASQPLHAPQRRRGRGGERGPSVETALEPFPDTRIFTRPEWIDKEDQEIQQFLLLLYVLLALSVIISLFGMVNTLALSVFERTRELGMLRAVGMTRRQTRRMIRHESVITALIGAALGLPLGIFLAVLVTRALGQYDLRFALPVGQLVVLTIVAVIAGLLAAITPARRAAKLDPLRALQYE